MQSLMDDQPQPTCDSPKNNSAERHGGDYDHPEKQGVEKWSLWVWFETKHHAVIAWLVQSDAGHK